MSDPSQLSAYLDAIDESRLFLAHNSNVDAVASASAVADDLEPPLEDRPESPLDSPAELATGIARSMERGDGDLVAITDAFGAWLEETLEPEETKLGGQAGIMADLLSVTGGHPVLYTYLLTETQRSMFTDPADIEFTIVEDGDLSLYPMDEVTNADQTKINWIFEFEEGDEFYGVRAGTDSRFIAAARPERVNLDTGLLPVAADLADEVDGALLSGYHSLKRIYEDGSTYEDRVADGQAFIQALREDGDLPVQIEYGVTHKDELRAALAERVLPEVDAIGVDSRELDILVEDLDLESSREEDDVVGTYRRLERVREALDIPCMKAHRTHYFIAATAEDYCEPEAVRKGWDFASIVAAAKATKGVITQAEDLRVGLEVDFSTRGQDAVERLADHVGAEVEHDAVATERVVVHPNRVVPDPQGTVGIGDSVSVANFALEQALTSETEHSVSH